VAADLEGPVGSDGGDGPLGHDGLTGVWFAQLWRNGSTSDPPDESVNTPTGPTLFGLILGATGVSDIDLETALADAMGRMHQPGRRWSTSASMRSAHAHRRVEACNRLMCHDKLT